MYLHVHNVVCTYVCMTCVHYVCMYVRTMYVCMCTYVRMFMYIMCTMTLSLNYPYSRSSL